MLKAGFTALHVPPGIPDEASRRGIVFSLGTKDNHEQTTTSRPRFQVLEKASIIINLK